MSQTTTLNLTFYGPMAFVERSDGSYGVLVPNLPDGTEQDAMFATPNGKPKPLAPGTYTLSGVKSKQETTGELPHPPAGLVHVDEIAGSAIVFSGPTLKESNLRALFFSSTTSHY